jgi:sulfite reductase alpha subunit-like flavoprotein
MSQLKMICIPCPCPSSLDHLIRASYGSTGSGLSYEQGDSLGLWPSNPKKQAELLEMGEFFVLIT